MGAQSKDSLTAFQLQNYLTQKHRALCPPNPPLQDMTNLFSNTTWVSEI